MSFKSNQAHFVVQLSCKFHLTDLQNSYNWRLEKQLIKDYSRVLIMNDISRMHFTICKLSIQGLSVCNQRVACLIRRKDSNLHYLIFVLFNLKNIIDQSRTCVYSALVVYEWTLHAQRPIYNSIHFKYLECKKNYFKTCPKLVQVKAFNY